MGECKGCKERREKAVAFSQAVAQRLADWIRNPVGLPPSINQPLPPNPPESDDSSN